MSDFFILLMDDHFDIGDRRLGGPHPHAGFETVTVIPDGAIYDRDEGGTVNPGEVQWMTAGSGVIHNEDMNAKRRVRLLQLWLTLPKRTLDCARFSGNPFRFDCALRAWSRSRADA